MFRNNHIIIIIIIISVFFFFICIQTQKLNGLLVVTKGNVVVCY